MLILRTPSLNMVCSSCGGGKTCLIKYLTYELVPSICNYAYVFCGPNSLEDYEGFIPDKYLIPYDNTAEAKLKKLMAYQGIHKTPCLLILDDILGLAKFNSPLYSQLFTTYRHLNMTILFSTQYIHKVPTWARECAMFAFIFKQKTMRSLSAINENFIQKSNWEECKVFLDSSLKEEHSCCRVDLRTSQYSKVLPVPIISGMLIY
jgi:hypothetical protein